MHTVILSGLLGWADSVYRALVDAGYDCELNTKGNFIVVYNTTSATVEMFLSEKSYGGGRYTEID